MRKVAIWSLIGAALLGTFAVPAAGAATGTDNGVQLQATIGGHSLARADSNNALQLQPQATPLVDIRIVNNTRTPVSVRSIRLDGRVIGLSFFSYETGTPQTVVKPGKVGHIRYRVDLLGLKGQAVGWIPANLSIIDASGATIATQSFTADVRGSLLSVYGLFGLAVLAFAILTLAATLIGLARGRLPRSRIRRAFLFTIPGFAIGLTLTFSLSAIRLVAPRATLWIPLVLTSGAIAFVLGYLAPAPDLGDDDEEEDEEFIDLTETQLPPVPVPVAGGQTGPYDGTHRGNTTVIGGAGLERH